MDDIRAHLARFGKDLPYAMPLESRAEETEKRGEEPSREKEAPKPSGSGIAPLDTTGLRQALIDRPWDVNSPY